MVTCPENQDASYSVLFLYPKASASRPWAWIQSWQVRQTGSHVPTTRKNLPRPAMWWTSTDLPWHLARLKCTAHCWCSDKNCSRKKRYFFCSRIRFSLRGRSPLLRRTVLLDRDCSVRQKRIRGHDRIGLRGFFLRPGHRGRQDGKIVPKLDHLRGDPVGVLWSVRFEDIDTHVVAAGQSANHPARKVVEDRKS